MTCTDDEERQATEYKIERIQKLGYHLFLVVCSAKVNRLARINRNMVVLRHNKRELTVINPVRLHPECEGRLLQLGTIERIIRLAPRHGILHDKYYCRKFPELRRWAPALSQNNDLPVHRLFTEDDDAILPACHVFCFQETAEPECCLVILQDYVGNLLVTADALQAHRDNPYVNMPVRTKLAAHGMMSNDIVVPGPWLRLMRGGTAAGSEERRKALREDFEMLLRLDFERVVGATGVMIHQRAKERAVLAVERAFPSW